MVQRVTHDTYAQSTQGERLVPMASEAITSRAQQNHPHSASDGRGDALVQQPGFADQAAQPEDGDGVGRRSVPASSSSAESPRERLRSFQAVMT